MQFLIIQESLHRTNGTILMEVARFEQDSFFQMQFPLLCLELLNFCSFSFFVSLIILGLFLLLFSFSPTSSTFSSSSSASFWTFSSSIFSAHFSSSLLLPTLHPPHSASLSLEQQDKPFSIFYTIRIIDAQISLKKGNFRYHTSQKQGLLTSFWTNGITLYTVLQWTLLASLYLLHLSLCTELPNSK